MLRRLLAVCSSSSCLCCALVACNADLARDLRATRAAIVYGQDDRAEPFEVDDVQLQQLAYASSPAIALRADISRDDQGNVTLAGPSAGETFELCPDERFATQPSGALCSAVLIAPDIALTAGHCLTWMSCAKLALVFGYHYTSAGQLNALGGDDVYECSELLTIEVEDGGEQLADYAFVKLDRAVAAAYAPVELQTDPGLAGEGSTVSVIGHSAGLPTKVAAGVVVDARRDQADYFRATIDNFVGGSGSGVFDEQARLVGIAARGELDFAQDAAGCRRALRVLEDPLDKSAGERVVRLGAALEGLCAEHPDASPCAALDARDDARAAGACRALPSGSARAGAWAWTLSLLVVALARALVRRRAAGRAFAKRQRALR